MIEDPREVQRRKELDIEDGRGCSREDLANALVEINEGRMPADRLVLRELAKEMTAWPNLEVWIVSFFLLAKHSSLCGPKIFVMLYVLFFIQSTKFEHWIVFCASRMSFKS
jgi:hypothetical protein